MLETKTASKIWAIESMLFQLQSRALLLTISVAVGLPEVGTFMSLFQEVKVSIHQMVIWSRSAITSLAGLLINYSVKACHSLSVS